MDPIRLAPGHALLLQATLADGDVARAKYEEWASLVAFDEIDPEGYRLLPALSRNLDETGVVDALTPRLQGVRRRTWYANQLALSVIGDAIATLQQAGIEHRVLGGALSILQSRNDRGAYPLDALDLLLPVDRQDAALAAFGPLGWRSSRRMHGVHYLTHEKGGHLTVRDHIVHGVSADARRIADDFVWSRPRLMTIVGCDAQLINAEAELLFVAEYKLGGVHPLRALTEASILIASGTPIDWNNLLEQARLRQAGAALAALFGSLSPVLPQAAPKGFVDELMAPVPMAPTRRATEADAGPRSTFGMLRQACSSLWRSYGRAAHEQSHRRTLPGFARFLAGHWQLSSPWRLPGAIGRKGLRLLFGSARLL